MSALKAIVSKLPARWQAWLRRAKFRNDMRAGRFATDEQEYELLDRWVKQGEWVLDVGANVGHYTYRLSQLVGKSGRVIAFEPVPETFEVLTSNSRYYPFRNATFMNVAVSDRAEAAAMSIPRFDTGLDNFYMAHLSGDAGDVEVLCIAVDSLSLPARVSLVKIDAEGHERQALLGMTALLRKDKPLLIVETSSPQVIQSLEDLGYKSRRLEGSSNMIFEPDGGRHDGESGEVC